MTTPLTIPLHKKAPYGLTAGKTYTGELMAFVKVGSRASYVEPAWKVVDDFGRSRWVPTDYFDPNSDEPYGAGYQAPRLGTPLVQDTSSLAAMSFSSASEAPPVSDEDLAAQWEAAMNASA